VINGWTDALENKNWSETRDFVVMPTSCTTNFMYNTKRTIKKLLTASSGEWCVSMHICRICRPYTSVRRPRLPTRRGLHGRTALPSHLLAVPNVTAHPSVASVPTSYYSMWHYNFLCTLKGKEGAHATLCKFCGTRDCSFEEGTIVYVELVK